MLALCAPNSEIVHDTEVLCAKGNHCGSISIIWFAEPNNNLHGILVDLIHLRHLFSFLFLIILVYAESIDPESADLVRVA